MTFACSLAIAGLMIACVEQRIRGDGQYVAAGEEFGDRLTLELTDTTPLQSVLNIKWPAVAAPGMTEAQARERLGASPQVSERDGDRWARWKVDGGTLGVGYIDVGSDREARRWLLRLDPDEDELTQILAPVLHRYVVGRGYSEVGIISHKENRRLWIMLDDGKAGYMDLLTVPDGLPRLSQAP